MRYPDYKIHRSPDSSVISYVSHYDSDKLNVCFNTGSVYTFEGVSRQRFSQLVNSESIGKYFSAKIRGKFNSRCRDFDLERELNEALAK